MKSKALGLKTVAYLNEIGELLPSCKHVIDQDTLIKGYKVMELTRHIDDRMITLQRQGMISFALSSLGEEACAVASAAALQLGDWMYPQYRELGILFWRGYTPEQYLQHMFGTSKDPSLGRQMPNHFGSKELNVVTVSSSLGSKITHAAGCGYGMKLKKQPTVAICYFGDGSASKEDFHVGLNFAAVTHSPTIFFCRNNGYAISTPTAKQFAGHSIAMRGESYGITAYQVDGNDFFAIHETVALARKQCLEGKGPILIEAITYRLGAHSTSDDPSVYRTKEEEEGWKAKCPNKRLRLHLEAQGLWNPDKEAFMQKDIKEEVDLAIETAKRTAMPPLHSLITDVCFEIPPLLQEQFDEIKPLFEASDLCEGVPSCQK